MKLKKEELQDIKGGARRASSGIYYFVGGLVTVIIGLINGYQRPLMCSSSK